MKNKALFSKAEGGVEEFYPVNGKYFELEELQEKVGGNIEIVTIDEHNIFVINEDGKDRLPVNTAATTAALMHNAIFHDDYICGDVVVCKTEMVP